MYASVQIVGQEVRFGMHIIPEKAHNFQMRSKTVQHMLWNPETGIIPFAVSIEFKTIKFMINKLI